MRNRTIAALTTITLVAAACSSDADSGADDTSGTTAADSAPTVTQAATTQPATTQPATTQPATDTTTAAPTTESPTTTSDTGALPATPVVAQLADAYDFQGGTPDPALLPAQPGEVEAHWYRAGNVLAVVYVGLDATVDACPGNSAMLPTGFDFVSNAELPDAACPDFPTRIENSASQGVQVCDGQVAYLTLIPTDTSGQLFSSVERPVPDVNGVGLTGAVVLADPSVLPEIDPADLAC